MCETCFYRKAQILSSTRVPLTEDSLCRGSRGPAMKGIWMGQSKASGGQGTAVCLKNRKGLPLTAATGEATWAREPCAVAA